MVKVTFQYWISDLYPEDEDELYFIENNNNINNFWGLYIYVYLPIIRTTNIVQNTTSSPEDFDFKSFGFV